MMAYMLEAGVKKEVTAVMRSNYAVFGMNSINTDSIEHGHNIKGRPPTASEQLSSIAHYL
jgi:hypothetical protein